MSTFLIILSEVCDPEGIDLLKDRQALQRLTEAAEKAKMELSGVQEAVATHDSHIATYTLEIFGTMMSVTARKDCKETKRNQFVQLRECRLCRLNPIRFEGQDLFAFHHG